MVRAPKGPVGCVWSSPLLQCGLLKDVRTPKGSSATPASLRPGWASTGLRLAAGAVTPRAGLAEQCGW